MKDNSEMSDAMEESRTRYIVQETLMVDWLQCNETWMQKAKKGNCQKSKR